MTYTDEYKMEVRQPFCMMILKTAITIRQPPGTMQASEKKFNGLNMSQVLNLPKNSSKPRSLQQIILIFWNENTPLKTNKTLYSLTLCSDLDSQFQKLSSCAIFLRKYTTNIALRATLLKIMMKISACMSSLLLLAHLSGQLMMEMKV